MRTYKKALGISGGGFAIPGLAGAAEQVLSSGYKPDIISGISSGSILTFILVGSKNPIGVIKANAIGFNSDVAFEHPPMNEKGKITLRAIWTGLRNNYLASQDNLEETLKSFVSENEWFDYIYNPDSPDAIVIAVDYYTGARRKYNLRYETYDNAIKIVRASSTIPVFADPVYFRDDMLYDGGVRNHIPTEWVLENYEDIEETVSIFSRPADFAKIKAEDDLDGLVSVLLRTLQIMEYEISKSNERMADLICETRGIKSSNIYLPSLLKDAYDINHQAQMELYNAGKANAKSAGF